MSIDHWRILYSPHASIDEAIVDETWQSIDKIDRIVIAGRRVSNLDGVWLTSSFFLVNPDLYYGLTIEEVNLWENIYINYSLIDDGVDINGTFSRPRYHAIPKGLLKKGHNIIHIYLRSHKNWTLGISGSIILRSEDDFNYAKQRYKIFSEYVPIVVCVLCVGIVIALLIQFFFNRDEKEHFILALRLIGALVYFLTVGFPYDIFSIEFSFALWSIITPLVMTTFFLYYQAIYNLYFTSQNRILIAFCIFLSLIGFLNYRFLGGLDLSPILLPLSFFVSIAYSSFLLGKLNSVKPNKINFSFIIVELTGICLFIISLSGFLIFKVGGWNDPSVFLVILSVILLVNGVVYSARRNRMQKKMLDELHEKYVSQKITKSRLIPESTEEKLNTLMNFIQKNYAETLTRESLSVVVGLNPNYLSSLFRKYTGKSLVEYVNEIRILEACKKLRQTGPKIIDVAFSVGFYSLATFNRAFKQLMKLTPSEYKARNK